MNLLHVLLLLLWLLPVKTGCAQDDVKEALAPGWHEYKLPVGKTTRWFRVYVPKTLPANAPVVVLLHGGGQGMRKIFQENAGGTREWPRLAESEGFLLLTPNGTNTRNNNTRGDQQNWNDLRPDSSNRDSQADDVGFIRELLRWTETTYPVDAKRIYVTGASNGGMMTFRLLMEAPERFAAGAAFIANLPEDRSQYVVPGQTTPLMIANGTRDPLVKWEGGNVAGNRGRTLSTDATVEWWAAANKTDIVRKITETLPDRDSGDGCRIYKTLYPASSGGSPVLFYRVEGGGHAMPSISHALPNRPLVRRFIGPVCKDAEGAKLAWDFFKDKTRLR